MQFMARIGKEANMQHAGRGRGNVPCPVTTVRALQVAHCRAASAAARAAASVSSSILNVNLCKQSAFALVHLSEKLSANCLCV